MVLHSNAEGQPSITVGPTIMIPAFRITARTLDILIAVFIVGWGMAWLNPWWVHRNGPLVLAHWCIIIWIPIEAAMIARWGTTPGKALLGIRVLQQTGGYPTYAQAVGRSVGVWVLGLTFGLFLIFSP